MEMHRSCYYRHKINPNLPLRRQQMHYQLSAKKYAFLKEKDRFVDCSDLKNDYW